jgi:hypothetical protein
MPMDAYRSGDSFMVRLDMPGIDPDTLEAAITYAVPGLSDSTFTLHTAGWDSVAVEVDDRLIFKFPRSEAAELALVREARLLEMVRPAVTIRVPDLIVHHGPPLFSQHTKLQGEHLVTAHPGEPPPQSSSERRRRR